MVLIVPDIGDSSYVQEMTRMLLTTMDFAEIAVHQVRSKRSSLILGILRGNVQRRNVERMCR